VVRPDLLENRAAGRVGKRIPADHGACQPRAYVAVKKAISAVDIREKVAAAVQRLAFLLLGRSWPMVAGYTCGGRLAFGSSRFCIINREVQ